MTNLSAKKMIALAIEEHISSYSYQELSALRHTAEDWHDGASSMLLKFGRSNGILQGEKAYQKLFREAHKALGECRLDAPDERARLLKLIEFSQKITVIERRLTALVRNVNILRQMNVSKRILDLL